MISESSKNLYKALSKLKLKTENENVLLWGECPFFFGVFISAAYITFLYQVFSFIASFSESACCQIDVSLIYQCFASLHSLLCCSSFNQRIKGSKREGLGNWLQTLRSWHIPIPGQCLGMPQLHVFTGDESLKRRKGKEEEDWHNKSSITEKPSPTMLRNWPTAIPVT